MLFLLNTSKYIKERDGIKRSINVYIFITYRKKCWRNFNLQIEQRNLFFDIGRYDEINNSFSLSARSLHLRKCVMFERVTTTSPIPIFN